MTTRLLLLVCLAFARATSIPAQSNNCTLKPAFFTMHFGKGEVQDANIGYLLLYDRVFSSCPTDGHYSFTSFTGNCFRGDWHTLTEDHTIGDLQGNMLLVNSAPNKGMFFSTAVKGFKSGKTYQFGVWLMNICKPTRKCPFPFLPSLTIRLQAPSGKTIAQFVTGDLPRKEVPEWTNHKGVFTMPPSITELNLVLLNNTPGGCGNDFALDDISFRECVKSDPPDLAEPKKIIQVDQKKVSLVKKDNIKSSLPNLRHANNKKKEIVTVSKKEDPSYQKPLVRPRQIISAPVPLILKQRTNSLLRQIEAGKGEILVELYDNGEIDGDTVTVYHNNLLLVSRQRLTQKPIAFRLQVDKTQPYHELIMVANNLGSIPPNTSLMIVTANEKKHQLFISSSEQQNAKIVIHLKE